MAFIEVLKDRWKIPELAEVSGTITELVDFLWPCLIRGKQEFQGTHFVAEQ